MRYRWRQERSRCAPPGRDLRDRGAGSVADLVDDGRGKLSCDRSRVRWVLAVTDVERDDDEVRIDRERYRPGALGARYEACVQPRAAAADLLLHEPVTEDQLS